MKGRIKNMKFKFCSKCLFVILSLVLAIFLSGCGGLITPATDEAKIKVDMLAVDKSTVDTDNPDYSPEQTVTIYGSGFSADASVTVSVTRPDGQVGEWSVFSDGSGSFITTYQLDGIEGTYTVTATDGTNTATTMFTDNAPNFSFTITPDKTTTSQIRSYTVTITGKSPIKHKIGSVTIIFEDPTTWGTPSSITLTPPSGKTWSVGTGTNAPSAGTLNVYANTDADELDVGHVLTIGFSITAPSSSEKYDVTATAYDTINWTVPADSGSEKKTIDVENPPILNYVAGSLTPTSVVQGESVGFTVMVKNAGGLVARVTLSTDSTLSFTDGTNTYTTNLTSATGPIGPAATTLTFATVGVPSALAVGSYTPTLSLHAVGGVDYNGASFGPISLTTAPNTVTVTAPADTTPPVGSITINGDAPYTNSTDVTLNLAATAAVGVTRYRVADGTDASGGTVVTVTSNTSFSDNISWALPSGDGTKTVAVQYGDAVNWSANYTDNIVLDQTAPVIVAGTPTGTLGLNDWWTSDVTVPFSATDNLSGFTPDGALSIDLASKTTVGEGAALYVTSDGISDRAGNPAVVIQAGPFKVDWTLPVVTVDLPGTGVYILGQTVSATWSAVDPTPGSGLATASSGTVSIDTSTVGPKTFTVTATDNAGNKTVETVYYDVIYNFSGFFRPVDNLPTYNVAKAGSAIPVKFSLSGNQGLKIFESGYPKSSVIPYNSNGLLDAIEETVTAGNSSLSYDAAAGQYIYVWKTEKGWANSCRKLVVVLNDGTTHEAYFTFNK